MKFLWRAYAWVPLLMALISSPAWAADVNGYTAEYECRSGAPFCNVAVEVLVAQPCQQTITPSTTPTGDWSPLNTSNDVICVQGDNTARGVLTLSASGTSGTRKVLRYSGPSSDYPWNQSSGDRAKVRKIFFNGADYWIIYGLAFEASGVVGADGYRIEFTGASPSTDNIIHGTLVEGNASTPSSANHLYGGIGGGEISGNGAERLTIQYSVVRENYAAGTGHNCVGVGLQGTDVRVVNSQIYNWCEHNFQHGNSNNPTLPGMVLENSDVYYTPSFVNQEDNVVIKARFTAANPGRIIHSRIFGSRVGSGVSEGGGGTAINVGGGGSFATNYLSVENTIIYDSIWGIVYFPYGGTNHSIVGNIFYKIKQFNSTEPAPYNTYPVNVYGAVFSEYYLNSFIDTTRNFDLADAQNNDLRCNVSISAGASFGTPGTGTELKHNVYYNSTHNNETIRIDNPILTRSNQTSYSLNTIIKTTGTPPANGTAGDNLYKVTTAGTSAGSPPSYCTSFGCETTDGTMVVTPIHQYYSFYQKLLTSPELVHTPYVRPGPLAPESNFCRGIGLGSRTGFGINNDVAGW